ncbi:hypothetical protein AB4K01_20020 [Serratia fonticola]|uniref:structural cement protein Gp24 n=1 Tax=Serratia fonticola TaxID=47917 RepID=UPI0034C5D0CA
MGNVILWRMPVGIAGAISRPNDLTAEPVLLRNDNPFPAYGLVGKRVNGFFVPLAASDTAAVFAGFYIRPFPTTSTPDQVRQVGPNANSSGDRLRRGYMNVATGATAVNIVAGTPVNVRIANPSASSPLGTALPAAITDETVVYPGAYFTGPGDADGNAEIEFNI